MKWDSIIEAYPQNREDILKAREIRDITHNILQKEYSKLKIKAPSTDETGISILEQDPVHSEILALLEGICIRAWNQAFENNSQENIKDKIGHILSTGYLTKDTGQDIRLEMTVHNVTKGVLFFLRKENEDIIPKTWSHGKCPFCGTYPRLAYDSEDKRMLCCPICGHTWRFPRLRCPCCNNTDHNLLGYFEADGIEGIRVYFCKKCKHYIKSIDTRKRAVLDPQTDDVLSLEMDNLALKEGFVA